MKKLFSLLAIGTLVFTINCSKIIENNDPVIGIWSNEAITSASPTDKQTIRQEWIFNDAYLGRYHTYTNQNLEFKTDFKWCQENGTYTISYPGTDIPNNKVFMEVSSEEAVMLLDIKGNILAIKE